MVTNFTFLWVIVIGAFIVVYALLFAQNAALTASTILEETFGTATSDIYAYRYTISATNGHEGTAQAGAATTITLADTEGKVIVADFFFRQGEPGRHGGRQLGAVAAPARRLVAVGLYPQGAAPCGAPQPGRRWPTR